MISEHPVWRALSQSEINTLVSGSGPTIGMLIERLYDRLTGFTENSTVIKQLNRMEETLVATNTGVAQLQQLANEQATTITQLIGAFDAFVTAQTAANTRMQNSINALLNLSGSGDQAALEAIATEMNTTLQTSQAFLQQLNAAASTEAGVDLLVVTPSTVTVQQGTTQQFTANLPVTWSATSGLINSTGGLYTPPADPTITSDTVTAITTDTTQTATANVTITPAAASTTTTTTTAPPVATGSAQTAAKK